MSAPPFYWQIVHGEGAQTGYVYSRFVTYEGRRYRLAITRVGYRSNTLLVKQPVLYYVLWLDDMEPREEEPNGPLLVGARTAAELKQVAKDLIGSGVLLSVPKGG